MDAVVILGREIQGREAAFTEGRGGARVSTEEFLGGERLALDRKSVV